MLFFQPHETKRRLFEFRVRAVPGGTGVPSGPHLVSGGYARRWAPFDTVDVLP